MNIPHLLTRPVKSLIVVLVLGCLSLAAPDARAELVTYDVVVTNAGPIFVGDTIDWEIYATVSESTASNFGIATASVNLADSTGETLNPGTIGAPFADYNFLQSGGTFNSGTGELAFIGAAQSQQNNSIVEGMDPANGGNLGPILLASGSYVVTQIGMHSLTTLTNVDENQYFTALNSFDTSTLPRAFGSAEFEVLAAVPEPSSLAMIGLALCGAWGVRRRHPKSESAA